MFIVNQKPDLAGGHGQSVRKEITHNERTHAVKKHLGHLFWHLRIQYVMQIFSDTSMLILLSWTFFFYRWCMIESFNSSHMTSCNQLGWMIRWPLSLLWALWLLQFNVPHVLILYLCYHSAVSLWLHVIKRCENFLSGYLMIILIVTHI